MKKMLGLTIVSLLVVTVACKKEVKSDKNEIETTQSKEMKVTTDYKGVYLGILPCASCSGIETSIILNEDYSYEKTVKYLESEQENIITKGNFEWSSDKTRIKIEDNEYLLEQGQLVMLDKKGNIIKGSLASDYVLKKQ